MSSPDGIGFAAAFAGGVVSFASPCVLPLVPAYLSVVTGLNVAQLDGATQRTTVRVARDTSMFVAGFSAVFVTLGISATALGGFLVRNQTWLTRGAGLAVLAMALFVLGSLVLKAPWMFRELRFHPRFDRYGPLVAPVTGAAFAFGWTPCVGPVLGAVLAVAAGTGSAWHGGALLATYSAGLGVPFLLTGVAMARTAAATAWVKRHYLAVTVTSATSMACFGILLALNRMTLVTSGLQAAARAVGLDGLVTLG